MDILKALDGRDFILTEAAVLEELRRSGKVCLHPRLENALLIYDEEGQQALSRLYTDFIDVAHSAGVPITICTPTWRANEERLSTARVKHDVNADAARFLRRLRKRWGSWEENTFIGGLVGCRNDCYQPLQALAKEDAETFHAWQVGKLAGAGVDFLLAATMPALPEAAGMAVAMSGTNIPFIISFVINKQGRILDGTSLEHAFAEIDALCPRPPLGFMINCAYPSFLQADKQPQAVLSRLIGFQANASSLDHSELDGAESLQEDEISDWGSRMVELNRTYGVKILGGCCGTNLEHLRYLVRHINNQPL